MTSISIKQLNSVRNSVYTTLVDGKTGFSDVDKSYLNLVCEAVRRVSLRKSNEEVITFMWPIVPNGAEVAAKWLLNEQEKVTGTSESTPGPSDAGQEAAPPSKKRRGEDPAEEPPAQRQKTSIKRLVDFHVELLQELLKGQPLAEEVVQLLDDSKIVVDGGASAEILEWHVNYLQDLAGGLPGNKIASALSVLRQCISHAKSVGY